MYEKTLLIKDEKNCSGESLLKLLIDIFEVEKFSYVLMVDVDGAKVGELLPESGAAKLIAVDKFAEYLREVVQFDSGEFYFGNNKTELECLDVQLGYSKLVEEVRLGVMAVDNAFIAVTSINSDVRNLVRTNFVIEEC